MELFVLCTENTQTDKHGIKYVLRKYSDGRGDGFVEIPPNVRKPDVQSNNQVVRSNI